MSNIYDGLLKFNGTWRSYQEDVLKKADDYLKDGKIHIVAAPGAGKTTLGIELIRRTGRPCIILSPRIVIREQWLTKVRDAFTEGNGPSEKENLSNDSELSEKENLSNNSELSENENLSKGSGTTDGLLSNDIRTPAKITAITYQTLFSSMSKIKGKTIKDDDTDDTLETDAEVSGDVPSEEIDYSSFDIKAAIDDAEVSVVCLDECHHLRHEWWKALEEFLKYLRSTGREIIIIALTATPPYDSTETEWARYENTCGTIDCEITIPELVKEGSLCPHQDYVYFNYPTIEEQKKISRFVHSAAWKFETLMKDEELKRRISTNSALQDPLNTADDMLDNPEYLEALIVYAREKKILYSKKWEKLLVRNYHGIMNLRHMENLLQGFLYNDQTGYTDERYQELYCHDEDKKNNLPEQKPGSSAIQTENQNIDQNADEDKNQSAMTMHEYREKLMKSLQVDGLMANKKVSFSRSDAIEKMMGRSLGKMESIIDIASKEYINMGENLRLLVLTDFIKKEYLDRIGQEPFTPEDLGVIPIFEVLRRENSAWKIAVLSGSIVIIPDTAEDMLRSAVKNINPKTIVGLSSLKDQNNSSIGYSIATVSGAGQILTRAMTDIYGQGAFQIMIGTKSLLGEGWDAPCINSLIFASFVGSYILGNQMRGRAIRVDGNDPDKVSNIWHLVCVPGKEERRDINGSTSMFVDLWREVADYNVFSRRMRGVLGLSYDGKSIEDGTDRFKKIIHGPYMQLTFKNINSNMLQAAKNRAKVRDDWKSAVMDLDVRNTRMVIGMDPREVPPVACFNNYVGFGVAIIIIALACGIFFSGDGSLSMLAPAIMLMGAGVIATGIAKRRSPLNRMKQFGKGVLVALKECNLLEQDRMIETFQRDGFFAEASLINGTDYEKKLFADSMYEFFSIVKHQRYVLVNSQVISGELKYMVVPEIFSGSRERADLFARCMNDAVGMKYEAVYTRNEAGRKILLAAQTMAWANRSRREEQRINEAFKRMMI